MIEIEEAALLRSLSVALLTAFLSIAVTSPTTAAVLEKVSPTVAKSKGCLSCHEGIEDIREKGSEMLNRVKAIGESVGDPGGCVTCHGGNPQGRYRECVSTTTIRMVPRQIRTIFSPWFSVL
ncbi:MAG: hypothetical protein VW338_16130 [Rhodospirillaceae bacterium]